MSRLALQRQKGFSLVETVIYAALLVVVTVLVVSGLMQLSTAYAKVKNERKINEAATIALDRAVREFRRATSTPAYFLNEGGDFDEASTTMFGTFTEQVRRDGAVSHWDFEETSGGTLKDVIGSKDAVLATQHYFLGATVPTSFDSAQLAQEAIVGKGVLFDGVDDYFLVPADAFNTHSEGTIEVIADTTDTGWGAIFSANQATATLGEGGMFLKVGTSASKKPMHFKNTFSQQYCANDANTDLTQVGFAQLAISQTANSVPIFVLNGDQRVLTSFGSLIPGCPVVNPSPAAAWFSTIAFFSANNPNPALRHVWYWIGKAKEPNLDPVAYKGIIDELVIYGAPLAAAKLKAHHEAAFGITPSVSVDHEVTKSLQVENGALVLKMMLADGSNTTAYRQKLTSDGVTVTAFNVTGVGAIVSGGKTKYKGIHIELTLQSGVGKTLSTETFYATVTPRVTE